MVIKYKHNLKINLFLSDRYGDQAISSYPVLQADSVHAAVRPLKMGAVKMDVGSKAAPSRLVSWG